MKVPSGFPSLRRPLPSTMETTSISKVETPELPPAQWATTPRTSLIILPTTNLRPLTGLSLRNTPTKATSSCLEPQQVAIEIRTRMALSRATPTTCSATSCFLTALDSSICRTHGEMRGSSGTGLILATCGPMQPNRKLATLIEMMELSSCPTITTGNSSLRPTTTLTHRIGPVPASSCSMTTVLVMPRPSTT